MAESGTVQDTIRGSYRDRVHNNDLHEQAMKKDASKNVDMGVIISGDKITTSHITIIITKILNDFFSAIIFSIFKHQ